MIVFMKMMYDLILLVIHRIPLIRNLHSMVCCIAFSHYLVVLPAYLLFQANVVFQKRMIIVGTSLGFL